VIDDGELSFDGIGFGLKSKWNWLEKQEKSKSNWLEFDHFFFQRRCG